MVSEHEEVVEAITGQQYLSTINDDFEPPADRFAAEIEDCGQAVIKKRAVTTGGERASNVSQPASPTVAFEGLLLKKGRYSVIPQAGDVLTALKLAEIREVRCEKNAWSKVDEYRDLT
jgi:hypothetical protein